MTSPLVRPGPERRRAGTALLAYGLVGLLLLGGLAVAVVGAGIMGRDGFTRLDDTIDEVVAVLDSTAASLQQAEVTLTGVGTSLEATADVLAEAAVLTGIASDGAATLADTAGSFGVLGQRPLDGMVEPLLEAGESLDRLGVSLAEASASLDVNADDIRALGERLGTLAENLTVVRDRIAGVDTQLGGAAAVVIGVVLVMLGWLAVPALAATWIGRRWRRENPAEG
jgi:hypothetical protein